MSAPAFTPASALREARRRWGKKGAIQAHPRCHLMTLKSGKKICPHHSDDCPGGRPVFQVGHVALGMFFMVEGSGATWAEAFVAADKKKADDAKRYAELRAARGEP